MFCRYDLTLQLLFWTIFALWGYSWLDVKLHGHKYQDRKEWKSTDPNLLSEAIFAITTVVAFCKLFYFFQTGHELGPLIVSQGSCCLRNEHWVLGVAHLENCFVALLQVSFSRMFKDITDFVQIYLCVLVSFSLGMARLYYYYKGQVKTKDGETEAQSNIFMGYTDIPSLIHVPSHCGVFGLRGLVCTRAHSRSFLCSFLQVQ